MNLPKGLASKIAATGFMSPKGMSAPQRMGGQSGFNANRPPSGIATRPPIIANKARGTMASHSYSQIPNSMSGMGQIQRPMREVMQNKRQADASGYSTMPLQKAQPTGTAGFAAGIKPKRIA